MSSDKQLNVQISIVSDSCPNKQNDKQQCGFECSLDNITANIVLENETVTDGENQLSEEYTKDNGNGQSENEELPPIEKINSSEKPLASRVVNENHFQGITETKENNQSEGSCHTNVGNGEATTVPVCEEKPIKVDSQTPQSVDRSNERVADICNEKQPQNLSPDTENQRIQQDNSNEMHSKEPEVVTEASNQIAESTTVEASAADDDEAEQDDEVSNDENDIFSNEHESNEDSSEFPDLVDFDGTNEVENDEYILDTCVRKQRKERRRIRIDSDDDSDPEIEVERERLLQQSPVIEENDFNDMDGREEDIDIDMLIRSDKPGPKSKKISTQKLKEFQARELLRNAVVIPSSSKKKKSRIIDSDDDEESALLPYCVDVDDIGLVDTTDIDNETDGLLAVNSILLNDIEKSDSSLVENSNQNSSTATSSDANDSHGIAVKAEPEDEHMPAVCQATGSTKCSSEIKQELKKEPSDELPSEDVDESSVATKKETAFMCDSGNGTDSANQRCKKENEIHKVTTDFPPFPSSSSSDNEDEFIPNDVYFGTPDANNRRSSRGKAGHTKGRPAPSSSRERRISESVKEKVRTTARRGGRLPRGEKFVDDRRISSTSGSMSTSSSSESEDGYQKSKARRKPETVTIVTQPLQLYKASLPTRPVPKQQQIQHQRPKQRDRFYDKSQDIPNSIYFGDVDVPLHVLHAYGDSDSDAGPGISSKLKAGGVRNEPSKSNQFHSQISRGRGRTNGPSNPVGQLHSDAIRRQHTMAHQRAMANQRAMAHQQTMAIRHATKAYSDNQKARGRPKVTSVSPSSDQSIRTMKKYLKAAGLKKVKLNRLWEGCKSNSERAEKMLELLREKGLEGEPTISKCKQLKVDYLTKKEIEDLDPNLIIQAEGRTRRSARAATKRQYTYDEDEILETRTKLRKVIDSDSDFD